VKQTDLVSGFSELKDILIRAYGIDRPRNRIKLYFTEGENELHMHDDSDHKKIVPLVDNLREKYILPFNEKKATALIRESLNHNEPALFLNEEFESYGFFISRRLKF
jgi:hypothetical protein